MKKDNDPFGFNKAINWDKLEDPKVIEELLTQWCIYTIGAGSGTMDIKRKLQAASVKRYS